MPLAAKLTALENKLDALFERINCLELDDMEVRADFAKYLCVRVSGYIEQAIELIVLEHCQTRASDTVRQFVTRTIGRFQNLKASKLGELLGRFSHDWQARLERYLADSEADAKGALDSVVALRNQIAHGGDVTVTYRRVRDYYDRIKPVVAFVDGLLS